MKTTITLILLSLPGLVLNAQYGSSNYEEGLAVYYADDLQGQATSYGEVYQREGFTAAHPFYPPGTIVRVTRLDNGQSVQVRVNDKMAQDSERRIILSRAAAMEIGLITAGKLRVRIERADTGANLPSDYSARQGISYSSGDNRLGRVTAKSPYSEFNYSSGTLPATDSRYTSATNSPAYLSPQPAASESISSYRAPSSAGGSSSVVRNSGRALAPGIAGYVIQLASYEDGTLAVNNVNQLLKRGVQHVYIWEKDGNNRVVIARFNDKANATEYLQGLRQQYLLDGIIVQLR
ncbi:MAG: hypothetical protein KDD01_26540 [Phaeodactylibacter sp.]|nr:hypothetical protein [Phaeodactylibacter sp.]